MRVYKGDDGRARRRGVVKGDVEFRDPHGPCAARHALLLYLAELAWERMLEGIVNTEVC